MNPLLESLPAEPMQMLATWLDDARKKSHTPNTHSMVLTTVAMQKGEILPSSRVVLCRHLDTENGFVVFYSNYHSRKGRELTEIKNAAAVFHWDAMDRQVRVEGFAVRSPVGESEAFFASRSRESQIAALASAQSEPVASRAAMLEQVEEVAQRYASSETIPCPPHWGGYRLWATAVEFWVQGESRVQDRARWIRTVAMDDNGNPHPGTWTVTRLQP